MKNNKVKFFLLTSSTLVIVIASIFLFRKVSYGNLSSGNDHDYWDGVTVSSSLSGSGTSTNPYLISNGADFAKFVQQVDGYNYKKYYKLTADIYLNKGYFFYNKGNDQIVYCLEGREYFMLGNSTAYYADPGYTNAIGNVNSISTINSSRAILDGDSHSIIGLYVYDDNNNDDAVSLFNELNVGGTVKNVNFLNSVIMGKDDVGLINNLKTGYVQSVIYNGIIYNSRGNYSATTVNGQATYSNNTISLSITPESDQYVYEKAAVSGTSNVSFQYNGKTYNVGNFTINLDYTTDSLELTPTSGTLNITNLSYVGYRRKRTNCGLIANYYSQNDNTVDHISVHGTISGWGNVGALIGKIHGYSSASGSSNTRTIQHCYNNAKIYSKYIAGGLIGYVEGNNEYRFYALYNNANITGKITGGILGYINYNYNNMYLRFRYIYNLSEDYSSDGQIIGSIQLASNITYRDANVANNCLYIHQGKRAIGTNNLPDTDVFDSMAYDARSSILTVDYLSGTNFKTSNGYVLTDGKVPYFTNDDVDAPNITISSNYQGINDLTNNDYYNTINKIIIPYYNNYRLTYSYTDASEIGVIEADFDDSGYAYGVDDLYKPDDHIVSSSSGSTFYIDHNTANILQVRIIDEYGNVGLARSDMIISDCYPLTFSEGVNHNLLTLDTNFAIDEALNSEIQINNHLDHELEIDFFPYSSSAKLYFQSENALPNNTELYLFDYINNNIYKLVITSQITPTIISNKYYYDLSLFTSIYNNSNYDNLLINHYDGSTIEEDLDIIIKYQIESGSNYFERNMGQNMAIIDNNEVYANNNSRSFYNLVSPEYHNSYNLTTTTNGSLSLSTINSNMTINYNISNNTNTVNNNSDNYYIYDQINNYTQKYLKLEIIDSNNNKITNFVPFNVQYVINNTTYHGSNNGTTYIPITSDTGTITATVLDNTNLDVKSGNYSLKITACNKYSDDISGSTTIPITINNAKPINNNSFQVVIDEGCRFINKNNGQTNYGNNTFHFNLNYTGTLTAATAKIKLKKVTEIGNYFSTTNVNPNTIFNQSFSSGGVYNNDTYYNLVSSNLVSGTSYNFSIPIKTSSLPEGKYFLTIALFNGNTFVTEEQFNIIIK